MAPTADRETRPGRRAGDLLIGVSVLHSFYPAHSSTITPPTRIRLRFSRLVPSRIQRFSALRSSRRTTSSNGATGSASPSMDWRSRQRGSSRSWGRRSSSRRSGASPGFLRRRVRRCEAKARHIATTRDASRNSFRCRRSTRELKRADPAISHFYPALSEASCLQPCVTSARTRGCLRSGACGLGLRSTSPLVPSWRARVRARAHR